MFECKWQLRVAAHLDGESIPGAEHHLESCPACQAYAHKLTGLRTAVQSSIPVHNTIEDPQFPAFWAGIEEALHPQPRHRGIWAKLSLSAAALFLALATFYLVTLGPDTVKATEIEQISTELEGATVDWYDAGDGSATVQVNMKEDDLW